MKSIFDTFNESLRTTELEDIVLNEAFQSKAIQQIWSKGGLGKELLAGYDKYGFALNEIKDGTDIIEVRGPNKADGEHYWKYQEFLHQESQKLTSKMEKRGGYGGRPETLEKSTVYSYDLLVVSDRGLEARFRKESGGHGRNTWALYEKGKNFLKGKRKPGFEDLYDYLAENPSTKTYLIVTRPKGKTETREEKGKATGSRYAKGGPNPQKEIAKTMYYDVKKMGEDIVSKFFAPLSKIADIDVGNNGYVRFKIKGSREEICTISLDRFSFREEGPMTRKNVEFNYYTNGTTFENKIEIERLQHLGAIIAFTDQNMDKLLALINKSKEYEKQRMNALDPWGSKKK